MSDPMILLLHQLRRRLNLPAHRSTDGVPDSLPMYFLPIKTDESARMNAQNRKLLAFFTLGQIFSTLLSAAVIWDGYPNFYVQAAVMFGRVWMLLALFAAGSLSLLPFLALQLLAPRHEWRLCISRWAEIGLLAVGIGWTLLSISSVRIDAGFFVGLMIFNAVYSFGFAYLIADSINTESRVYGQAEG